MKWLGRLFLIALLALLGWWIWGKYFVSDETRIKRQLTAMKSAVEQGNLLRLEGHIAQDYSDDRGLDKSTLLAAVRSYRGQYDALLIFLTDVSVEVEADAKNARAVFIAKVLVKRKGSLEQTELFTERFRVFFRKNEQGWQMIRAESPELKFD